MKILIIAATHGNELLGVKLYKRMLQRHASVLEYVDFMIGNPRAYAKKKRYTEFDLNRAYGQEGGTYEHIRAREIRSRILATKPDIVLDMHTTNCVQPSCLIVRNLEGEAKKRYLSASHISRVLQVQPMGDIVSVADTVIGYEVANSQLQIDTLDQIIADLQRFIDGESPYRTKKVYTMHDKIYKKDVSAAQAKSFVNFEPHPFGYVPIMTGESSYKRNTDYLGFKASTPEEITV